MNKFEMNGNSILLESASVCGSACAVAVNYSASRVLICFQRAASMFYTE